MARVLTDNCCTICGIPLDAEYFDVSGFVGDGEAVDKFKGFGLQPPDPLPRRGEQVVLASFQLHPQYCGVLTYFSQYTDLYTEDNRLILTPGFEWSILQNGKPVYPYTQLGLIVNPWGYNCLPVLVRLDENARVEFVLRNRSISDDRFTGTNSYPIRAFAGRIMGRYWYNDSFGGRVRS
jgi:hypothetical protein